ncbi:DUF4333 domain-containing protein [Spirillospora albida]|uniref:DUF4333 domain-containing protein n=1 Tax=Spirillospora albida TaxID=58123 RepID=UPI00147042A4|nr:DUF4333 domain-containing protein [Spirillospora albida]
MRRSLLVPAVLAVALTSACTVNLGDLGAKVERDKVEEQVSTRLASQLGGTPRSVTCPGDLKGEVGAKLQCSLVTAAGETQDVAVNVTSVEGSTVKFDIKSTPRSSPTPTQSTPSNVPAVERNVLEPRISELLTPSLGAAPKYVVCPENLRGVPGVTMQCQLVDQGGVERQVLVTVTSVVGTTVNFNLKLLS